MGWGDRWTCYGARVGVSEGRGCMIVISCNFHGNGTHVYVTRIYLHSA